MVSLPWVYMTRVGRYCSRCGKRKKKVTSTLCGAPIDNAGYVYSSYLRILHFVSEAGIPKPRFHCMNEPCLVELCCEGCLWGGVERDVGWGRGGWRPNPVADTAGHVCG